MIEIIKENLAAIIGLFIPTAVIAFSLYQRFNSNSSASIINKLWSLLVGEKDYYNAKINDFSKQQHDIDKFNLAYGFRFDSIQKIERFLEWTRKNNFQIHWFSGLGYRFNSSTFQLRPMKTKHKLILFLQFIGVTATSIFLVWQYFNDSLPKTTDGSVIFPFYILVFEVFLAYYLTIVRIKALYKSKLAKKKMKASIIKKIKPS